LGAAEPGLTAVLIKILSAIVAISFGLCLYYDPPVQIMQPRTLFNLAGAYWESGHPYLAKGLWHQVAAYEQFYGPIKKKHRLNRHWNLVLKARGNLITFEEFKRRGMLNAKKKN